LTVWATVELARHPDRPSSLDYIELLGDEFVELHGDRAGADDPAIVGGPARIDGNSVMVIAQQKGRTPAERVERNYGMAHPWGYRKALRLMRQAERFGLPLVTLIDTSGAYPGVDAEAHRPGLGHIRVPDHDGPAAAPHSRRDHRRRRQRWRPGAGRRRPDPDA